MAEKTALVRQIKGLAFAGLTDSGHWVAMDGPVDLGGSDAGTRPKELLLVALGGCTGADVVSILQKKRVKLAGFEIKLKAEVAEEHPQVFTKIHLEYLFYGENLAPKDLERAIELSQTKYCSVTAMLKKAVEITYSYKVLASAEYSAAAPAL